MSQLARQRAATVGAYQREVSGNERRHRELNRAETMLGRLERELDLPLSGTTTAVRTLITHRDALTTYIRFPLEAQRQRLLEMADQ